MGYTSDVAIRVCYKGDTNPLIAKLNDEGFALLKSADESFADVYEVGDSYQYQVTYVFYGIKWYDYDFPDVINIMDAVRELIEAARDYEDMDCNEADKLTETVIGMQYLRIGEEMDDMEEEYAGDVHSPMYISREIDINR